MNENALEIADICKVFLKDDRESKNGNGHGWSRLFRPFRRVHKKQTTVVDTVNIQVPRGMIYGILGPNGSGKSTLIRMIATLLLPDDGEIRVFGHDVVSDPLAVQRLINRVSVDAAFFKKLSAMENLIYAARLYGMQPGDAVRRARDILGRLGFDLKKLDSSMSELSRGMQQKVAIARGFLTSPVLLLLDEPTTGLDPRSKKDVQEFIKQIRKEHDATILLTTHDMAEAEALCDRVAILCKGKVIAVDTVAGLKAQARVNGHEPSLEEVFIKMTGEQLCGTEEE